MQGFRYTKTGSPIQVGGMVGLDNTSGNASGTVAVAVSGFIEIQDVTGSGGFVQFGTDDTIGQPNANGTTAGSFYIPPFGITRPFAVPTGKTHVRGSASINVRSLG